MNGSNIQHNGVNILTDVYTNYEAAIAVTDNSYNIDLPSAGKTVAYFITDGEPTKEYNDNTSSLTDVTAAYTQDSTGDSFIDSTYLNTWTNFINTNSIDLEVFAIGPKENLDKSSLDALQVIDGKSYISVTNSTGLSSALLKTIESVTGSLYGDSTLDQDLSLVIGIDETFTYNGTVAVDGGAGTDTLTLDNNMSLDFSDANMANIANIEKIDLSAGNHEITLSLSDVLDMTDPDHQLIITGDTNDTLHFSNDLAGSGWAQTNDGAESNGNGAATYSYSDGSDTLTLTVDENIQNTGL